jgi:hypothetical protein
MLFAIGWRGAAGDFLDWKRLRTISISALPLAPFSAAL